MQWHHNSIHFRLAMYNRIRCLVQLKTIALYSLPYT